GSRGQHHAVCLYILVSMVSDLGVVDYL
ncbi:MAG: hypothetical protein RL166_241, partial [Actinomycetota bacterium]